MKKIFAQLLITLASSTCIYCADNRNNDNPGVALNPQDVPIFYDNNPLTGMNNFVVLFSTPLKDISIQNVLENSAERALESVGQVVRLKENDIRGFGAGNVLLIQIGNVTEFNEKETLISRLSLSIETPITLEKTGIKTFPMVWSISEFLQDANSEETLTKATKKLMSNFVQNYQYANRNQVKKPIFYVYD